MTELEVLNEKLGKVVDPKNNDVFCNMSEQFKSDVIKAISTIYDLNKEYKPLSKYREGVFKDSAGFDQYLLPLNNLVMGVNNGRYLKFSSPYERFSFTDNYKDKLGCIIRGEISIPIHDDKNRIESYGYLTIAGEMTHHFTVYLYKSMLNQELITFWKFDTLKEAKDFIRATNFEHILKNSDKFKRDISELMPGRYK